MTQRAKRASTCNGLAQRSATGLEKAVVAPRRCGAQGKTQALAFKQRRQRKTPAFANDALTHNAATSPFRL
jgi:hypothetical protein